MIAELIERLENLSEPDRALDLHLAEIFVPDVIVLRHNRETGNNKRYTHWEYTGSIDAAVAFCDRVLPGWGWRVATCCVSDDAWVFPDFNSPEHGERLKRELDPSLDWTDLTDVDLRPPGRPAIALLISVLKAKQIIGAAA